MKIKIKFPGLKAIKHMVVSCVKGALNLMLLELAPILIIMIVSGLAILKGPEMHSKWLRYKVGSKVYTIRDSAKSGGGTGSAVVAPSGETYILTNDHVCEVSKDKQTVLVTDSEGNSLRRRIIAHDENSDLCLVEGMPGVEGLTIASDTPTQGDIIGVIGHPHLLPLLLSRGEMMGSQDVMILMGPIAQQNPATGEWEQFPTKFGGVTPEQCQMNKHRQIETSYNMIFFTVKVKLCAIYIHDAYITNVVILPGNSGSPVINFWGQVQGVAFASDSEANWGRMISLNDVKAFLKNY